jgi:hypothetical protein
VNGTSMSVDSVAASAASIKSVDGIGQKEVDGEALQIILLFVGALLMLLPAMCEKVGALFDSTMIVRISALISNAGNLTLTGYDIAKVPWSTPLPINGLLVGGLATRAFGAFSSAAVKSRGLPDSAIQELGKDIVSSHWHGKEFWQA